MRRASAASKLRAESRRSRATAMPDMGRQGGGVGGVGYAPQELGDPEGGPVAGHRDVGHHGDQQTPGLADAVDGGDDRRRAVPDGQERENVGARGRPRGDFLVLGRPPRSPPGAKTSPVPVMIRAASSGSELTRCTARLMPVVHGRGQGIPGVGPVDDAPGDRAVLLQSQVACAEVIGFVRCGCHRALSSRRLEVHGSCLPGTRVLRAG